MKIVRSFAKWFYGWAYRSEDQSSNYIAHLDREWEVLGWPTTGDDPQSWTYQHLKLLLREFSDEGHSGSSAPYAVGLFKKTSLFLPLSPLTGEDSEWMEIADGEFQNKRCSHVFKKHGVAYDIDGKVFVEPDGGAYTGKGSSVDVVFPYTPKREYVKVGFHNQTEE